MVNRHSKEAQQRRFIKRLVLESAFSDRQRGETVNVLSPSDIAACAGQVFKVFIPCAADYEKGEVLSDGRGAGTLQK